MLTVLILKIISEVLADPQHEGWSTVLAYFFTSLCDEGSNATFEKCVADAVTDMICDYLPDDVELDKPDIDLLYALYAEYASRYEARVQEHIMRKVYHSDLCEVV